MFFRRGDRGPAVAEIRARLSRLGLIEGSLHVRGDESMRALMYPAQGSAPINEPSQWETTALVSADFDEAVEQAVREFQRGRGITVDGIVGPETFRRLEEARWRLGDRVLSYQPGHPFVGEDVLQLQRQLNRMGFDCGKEDSHFGPLTDRGLREFQRNTGMQVDGVSGPETLRALGRLHRTVGQSSAHTARERYALGKLQTGIAGKTIVFDPGAGSTDLTASIAGDAGTAITRSIADLSAARLRGLGATVALTPLVDSAGQPVDELARARFCNERDADLVLSLQLDHFDPNTPALAVYFYGRSETVFSAAGREAAERLRDELASASGGGCAMDLRTWDILRATRMPSVRICFGQLDRLDARERLTDTSFRAAISTAISDGLAAFFAPRDASDPSASRPPEQRAGDTASAH